MKEYEIVWLPEALEDLNEIFEFIAQKSPIAAEKVIKSILNRPEQLKKYPKSGQQEIFLKEHENVRYLIEDHYKLFYLLLEDHVLITHVFDTRRSPDKKKY